MAKLTFRGDDLNAVIATALKHGTKVVLVKDDGIYIGARPKGKGKPTICYARGYDPRVAEVWDKCRDAAGGDDFVEDLGLSAEMLKTLSKPGAELVIGLNAKSMSIRAYGPPPPVAEERKRIEALARERGWTINRWIGIGADHIDVTFRNITGKMARGEMRLIRNRWRLVPHSAVLVGTMKVVSA